MQIPKLEIFNINKCGYKTSSKSYVQNVDLKMSNDNIQLLDYYYPVSFFGNKKFKSDNKKINSSLVGFFYQKIGLILLLFK